MLRDSSIWYRGFATLLGVAILAAPVLAQEEEPLKERELVPGVLKTIAPEVEEEELYSGPRPIVELVNSGLAPDWTPNFKPKNNTLREIASKQVFRRGVWCLEFTFKPVRTIDVEIPQPTGKMQRKTIWYMVYKVVNRGGHLREVKSEDKFGHVTYQTETYGEPVRFIPTFVLEAHEQEKAYLDQIIPIAIPAIQRKEDPAITFHSSVDIGRAEIPVSDDRIERPVWGVAIWEDVDPRTDYFSVYIQGLSNAYKFADPETFTAGATPGTGRKYAWKTLQLNFHRPGDEFNPSSNIINYGLPFPADPSLRERMLNMYGVEKRVDHRWIFR